MARRRYQRGSLHLLPSGWWILRWREDVVAEDGSIRRVGRKTRIGTREELPTEKQAWRAAEPILAKVNAREYRPGRFATMEAFVQTWKRDALAMLKPSTQRVHRSYLEGHILPAMGQVRLDELDQQRVQGFIAQLSQKVSPKTVRNIAGVLSAVLKSARAWGYSVGALSLADLVMPRRGLSNPRPFFSAEEVRAILGAAQFPDLAAYAVIAFTGCRGGEAFALTWDDLDFGSRLIRIRRGNYRGTIITTKSRHSDRTLPMPAPLADILQAYRKEWRPNLGGLLFVGPEGEPINPEAFRRWHLKPLLQRLGIRPAGFHAFRHSMASMLVSTGANVKVTQAQLGHSDPRVTLGLYSHLIGEDHRAAVEKVADILRPVAPGPRAKLLRIK